MPFAAGATVRFLAPVCATCPRREHCTSSARGRSVTIHPDGALLAELRESRQTTEGRAALRELVGVKPSPARIGHWQGAVARDVDLSDLRRMAVVSNLHDLMRLPDAPLAA